MTRSVLATVSFRKNWYMRTLPTVFILLESVRIFHQELLSSRIVPRHIRADDPETRAVLVSRVAPLVTLPRVHRASGVSDQVYDLEVPDKKRVHDFVDYFQLLLLVLI